MKQDMEVIESIRDILVERKETLAVAESVTSGQLQAAISVANQASLFFQGGITAYNGGQKCRHLDVEPIHAVETDCVSPKVAEQMALGVNRLFLSHYGVAVTGYATKVPEKGINELFAFFAIARGQDVLLSKRLQLEDQETAAAQNEYVQLIIRELNNLLSGRS